MKRVLNQTVSTLTTCIIEDNHNSTVFLNRKRPTVFDLPQTTRKQLAARNQHHQQDSNQSPQATPTKSSTTPAKGSSSKQQRVQHNRWVKRDRPHRGSKSKGTKETDIGSDEEQEDISGEETIDEESYERTPILYPCLSDLRVDIHDPDLPDGTQAVLGTILSGKFKLWHIYNATFMYMWIEMFNDPF